MTLVLNDKLTGMTKKNDNRYRCDMIIRIKNMNIIKWAVCIKWIILRLVKLQLSERLAIFLVFAPRKEGAFTIWDRFLIKKPFIYIRMNPILGKPHKKIKNSVKLNVFIGKNTLNNTWKWCITYLKKYIKTTVKSELQLKQLWCYKSKKSPAM